MKNILLVIFVTIPYLAVSQDFNTVYYNSNWEMTSMKYATYYRNSGFESNSLKFDSIVTDYYLNGTIEMTGRYNKGNKDGEFIYYYPNQAVKLISNYSENKRSGVWTLFYENGLKNKVVEYDYGRERLIEFNDQNGNSILKNLKGRYSFDLYYDYHYGVFSQDPPQQGYKTYTISGTLLNGLKHGKWKIMRHDQSSSRIGNGDWQTNNIKYKEIEFKYKNGILTQGLEYKSESKFSITSDTLTYFILEPEKIGITESIFSEPGQMIRHNFVIKAILDLKSKSRKPIELDKESELIDFFSENFSLYAGDCSKSILLTINIKYDEYGRVIANSISPKTSSGFEKEVYRIVSLISRVKNHSPFLFSFSYKIPCMDELDYKK
jgi:antitoxin component YwqK of YwqJK toxin-antitoxin module